MTKKEFLERVCIKYCEDSKDGKCSQPHGVLDKAAGTEIYPVAVVKGRQVILTETGYQPLVPRKNLAG